MNELLNNEEFQPIIKEFQSVVRKDFERLHKAGMSIETIENLMKQELDRLIIEIERKLNRLSSENGKINRQ